MKCNGNLEAHTFILVAEDIAAALRGAGPSDEQVDEVSVVPPRQHVADLAH